MQSNGLPGRCSPPGGPAALTCGDAPAGAPARGGIRCSPSQLGPADTPCVVSLRARAFRPGVLPGVDLTDAATRAEVRRGRRVPHTPRAAPQLAIWPAPQTQNPQVHITDRDPRRSGNFGSQRAYNTRSGRRRPLSGTDMSRAALLVAGSLPDARVIRAARGSGAHRNPGPSHMQRPVRVAPPRHRTSESPPFARPLQLRGGREVVPMPNRKQTSRAVARKAGRLLANPSTPKGVRSVAASAVAQARRSR
jgi:hypothetical protein